MMMTFSSGLSTSTSTRYQAEILSISEKSHNITNSKKRRLALTNTGEPIQRSVLFVFLCVFFFVVVFFCCSCFDSDDADFLKLFN